MCRLRAQPSARLPQHLGQGVGEADRAPEGPEGAARSAERELSAALRDHRPARASVLIVDALDWCQATTAGGIDVGSALVAPLRQVPRRAGS